MYLGIDQSLTHSGVVILDGKGNFQYGFAIKPKTRGVTRLKEIVATLRENLNPEFTYFTCMEGYSYGNMFGKAFELGELGGIIKCWAGSGLIVAPTTLKKFITGKGKLEKGIDKKDIIPRIVKEKWGFETKDDNIADAYGLARIAYLYEHQDECTKTELECIKAVRIF
jgi:Holliday junction resolvasome RuvABC endonuclease subunit